MANSLATYSLLLQDERWRRRREEILRLDIKCQGCGASDKREVHHIGYLPGLKPWEYFNENLVTLCKKCHDNVESFKHDKEAYEKWYIWLKEKMLRHNGRFISLIISSDYKYR